MNITEYQSKKASFGVEGTGVDVTTTQERTWSNKDKVVTTRIPKGTKVHVDFMPKMHPSQMWVTFEDQVLVARVSRGHVWLTGLRKPPTIRTLQKRSWDGISKSVTNHKVEPDGYGPDGAPAWELVMGLI